MSLEEIKKNIRKYSLSPKLFKQGQKIVKDIITKHNGVISVFACGSIVEKLSDEYSDFDIRVITNDFEGKENFEKNGIEVNVLFFSREIFERELNHHNEVLLRWIVNSVVLYDKNGYVEKLRENIIDNIPELVDDYITRAHKAYQDALGSFKKGEYEASLIMVRLATFAMIQALLFAHGDFCTLERWLFNKFKVLKEVSKEHLDMLAFILGLEQCTQEKAKSVLWSFSKLFNNFVNPKVAWALSDETLYLFAPEP